MKIALLPHMECHIARQDGAVCEGHLNGAGGGAGEVGAEDRDLAPGVAVSRQRAHKRRQAHRQPPYHAGSGPKVVL